MIKSLLRAALAVACATALLTVSATSPLAARTDKYPDSSVTSSCTHWSAITPTDGLELAQTPKALWVGTGGTINMIGADAPATATGVTWSGIPSGALMPVRPRQINATGTTASQIVGCY
jgi:hypothetical protein